jgi:hypothetical protein
MIERRDEVDEGSELPEVDPIGSAFGQVIAALVAGTEGDAAARKRAVEIIIAAHGRVVQVLATGRLN